MPEDATTPARPSVLLLAGDVREAWRAALAAAGFDVRTTGWLDGLTAARLRPPDLVLVSTDLPDGAVRVICTNFRSASGVSSIPIVVAGAGADRLDAEAREPFRADRYVPAAGPAHALVREVRDALRAGHRETPLEVLKVRLVALGLKLVGLAAIVAQVALSVDLGPARELRWRDLVPLAVFVAACAADFAIVVAARPRPASPLERRRLLGSAGTWIWMAGVLLPPRLPLARIAPLSLACAAWAVWAWLGPRVAPRSPAATRWFQLLAALLAILAAAPWLAWAWMTAS